MEYRLDFPIWVGNPAPLMAVATATDRIEASATKASLRMDQMNAGIASIAQSSLRTNVTLQAMAESLEKLTTGTARQTTAVNSLGAAHAHAVTDIQSAGAAIRAMEGSMNVRAVEQFTTRILNLGGAFRFIFPAVGLIATVEILGKAGEKVYELARSWDPVVRAQMKAKETLDDYNKSIDKSVKKLQELGDKEYERTYGKPALDKLQAERYGFEGRSVQAEILQAQADVDRLRATIAKGTIPAHFAPDLAIPGIPGIPGARKRAAGLADQMFVNTQGVNSINPQDVSAIRGGSVMDRIERSAAAVSREVAIASLPNALAKLESLKLSQSVSEAESRGKLSDAALYGPSDSSSRLRSFNRSLTRLDEEAQGAEGNKIGRILTRRGETLEDKSAEASELGIKDITGIRQRIITDFNKLILADLQKEGAKYSGVFSFTGDISQFLEPSKKADGKEFMQQLTRDDAALAKANRQDINSYDTITRGEVSGLRNQANKALRLAQASATPGGEVVAENDAYRTRVALAQRIFDIESNRIEVVETAEEKNNAIVRARKDMLEEIGKAEEDRTVRLAELRKQNQEKFVGQVEGGFRAAVSGGGPGLAKYIQSQGVDIGSTIVGNAARSIYRPGAFNIPGLSPDSGIGALLKGTPFVGGGPEDKQKNAADIQLKAATTMATAASMFYSSTTGNAAPSIPGLSLPSLSPGTLGVLGLGGAGGAFAGAVGAAGGSSSVSNFLARALGVSPQSVSNFGSGVASVGTYNSYNRLLGRDFSVVGPGGTMGSDGIPVGSATTASASGQSDRASQIGAGVGIGLTALAGGVTAYRQFSRGNTLGGIGTIAGTAAALDPEPISKAILAASATVISLFAGDPKANRQSGIDKLLATNTFYAPVARNISAGMNGGLSDYDRFGQSRSSDLSPYPMTENPYLDYKNSTYVPGRVTTGYGGYGPGGGPGATGAGGDGAGITIQIQALDTQSILDRHQDIASAVIVAMDRGGSGTQLTDKMRQL